MSKVKQWAEDTAEKSVDLILKKLKEGQINLENATTNILDVENVIASIILVEDLRVQRD